MPLPVSGRGSHTKLRDLHAVYGGNESACFRPILSEENGDVLQV